MIRRRLRALLTGRAGRRQGERGFTLIEVTAAVTIIAIVVVPLSVAMVVGYRTVFGIEEKLARSGDAQRLASYFPGDVQSVDPTGVNPTDSTNVDVCPPNPSAGETSLIRSWLRFGGEQTLRSYRLDPRRIALADDSALAALRNAIPEEHVAFLRGFADTCRFGDYLFVHAGIRPGIELDRQAQSDLRWIREPFLRDESDHGFIVVHGHTICREVEERPNRIGIDTGAYATGILTALAIEGADRWFVDSENASSAGSYAIHHVRAGYDHERSGVSLFVEGRNLADRDYVSSVVVDAGDDRFYEPGDGRSVFGGVEWRWH